MSTIPTKPVPFKQAIKFWLKLGFISFGGPAGQIAILHQELVDKRKWISEKRFLHALNFCMLLPGPEAMQLATYMGWLLHKTWGGIVAGVLFVVPSLFILIALAWLYLLYNDLPVMQAVFYGIKPAVVAIVLYAAYRIGTKTLKSPYLMGIALAAFIAIFVFHLPFPLIILTAALLGWLGGRYLSQADSKQSGLEDNWHRAEHTRFSWRQTIKVVLVGLLLWCLPMMVLYLGLGWSHTLTQMSWFFTKAAFLTFGGAYAVLPYVYQGAVVSYGWLSPTQMIDGLALGETTPGPLIMIVAFVAFVGAYIEAFFGTDFSLIAGISAALLVTWFSFLPSFIFVLLGAPLIESSHNNQYLTRPLKGITAAVVGVIVNLALFFAYHVLWADGWAGQFDWLAAIGMVLATLALIKFNLGVMTLLMLSAGLGLLTLWL
ncbi:MAG: chromate efflux transporter [Gammaproteobacteria bacterium]|nr:chromate efflux transporter [Gammaproteobacteria bacterium]